MKLLKLTLTALIAMTSITGFAQENSQAVLENIHSRKSVRSYTDRDVTPEQVETILKAAMAAPSGMNMQPWRFVVVTDPQVRNALGGLSAKASAVFVVCGETMMKGRPAEEGAEAPMVPNGNWNADCAAATENLLLAAEAIGLGAVWTACYPYEERMNQVRTVLGLPEGVTPYCVVPVGYPAGDDQPKDKWKPENIHYDRW